MAETEACGAPEHGQFDFWLGEWDLSWPAEQTGGQDGEIASGTNHIARLFGRCAVEERFSTADGTFRGRSLSVFDQRVGVWRQTWVDNTGGYLLFSGGLRDAGMELRTEVEERDDQRIVQRMAFNDIREDSLTWRWQGSRDGGGSWNDLWTISYRRSGS